MNLRQLEYFVQIAKAGSINKAADELAVSQSALSRQVRLLEESLDTALLDRSLRGTHLTADEEPLLRYGTAILDLVSESKCSLHGATPGEKRVPRWKE